MEPKYKNRMQKYREKLKQNSEKWKEYLEKEKIRDKERRNKFKLIVIKNKSLQAEKRKRDRERQARHRAKVKSGKKESTGVVETIDPPYKCPQTLGKALKRAELALPNSPRKKKIIVEKLMTKLVGRKDENSFSLLTKKRGCKSLSEENKITVKNFFEKDTISRQAPGKRDTKSIKDFSTGQKIQKQVRHMIMSVREAYQVFKKEFPDIIIGLSKFYDLRPKNVLLLSEMPHNVCVCQKHANFSSMVEGIGKVVPTFPQPVNYKILLNTISCDINQEQCMMNECNYCIDDINDLLPLRYNTGQKVSWNEWRMSESGRPEKYEVNADVVTAVEKLNAMLPTFKTHCFIKNIQSKYFENKIQKAVFDEAVMQVDFAENYYSVIQQDEIQSAHWAHSQVTIFTCCLWYNNGKTMSYAVISDELSHCKYSVWTFMKTIIDDFKKKFPTLKGLEIFSDNCAAQFKNKYNIANLCFMQDDFGITGSWQFFASSHGKGAVDGIGGTVKRMVWREVLGRKAIVKSAKEFHDCANKTIENIRLLYVSKADIEKNKNMLNERWKIVSSIPHLQLFHSFQPINKEAVVASKAASLDGKEVKVYGQNKRSRGRPCKTNQIG